ncbi:MAG TPA: LysM peptidoglycan-binding domain-containing protein, partial [Polyangiaceae bacterium]
RSWPVRVPPGTSSAVTQALAREMPEDESLFAYVVRAGDTVETIAQANGTTEALIRSINRIDSKEVLAAGGVLLVPRAERTADATAEERLVVVPPRVFGYPDKKRVFYRVLSGDSLGRVAELFRVARSDVSLWNALDGDARLHAGMVLQLFVPKRTNLAHVRHLPEDKARVLVAGSTEFFEYFEGQNGKRRLVVSAKGGDNLAGIGKRYGMSVGSMERVNRRSRTEPVRPGEPIVVYTERPRPAPGDALYVDALSRVTRDTPSDAIGATAGAAVASDGAALAAPGL